MDEKTKKANFKRLAESRTQKIIKAIETLGNLSNRSNYEYSDEQVDRIFNAIEEELRIQRAKFKKGGKTKFRL